MFSCLGTSSLCGYSLCLWWFICFLVGFVCCFLVFALLCVCCMVAASCGSFRWCVGDLVLVQAYVGALRLICWF